MTLAAERVRVNRRILASPLRYPGGKGALYARLRQMIRENGLAGCTYVEPYAGGAGAGLALLVSGQVGRIVINDLDPAIWAFWTTVVEAPDYLMERISNVTMSVIEWRSQKAVYAAGLSAGVRELGFATFYLNRTNRSGVLNGGPIGGLEQQGPYKIDARFPRAGLVERIRILALFADCIEVSRADGRAVIEEYGLRDDAFVYADPPYFEKAGSLYLNAFDAKSHQQLAATLNSLADRHWLLTYDDVPDVFELYPDRRIRQLALNYSAHRVVRARELAVLSDTLNDIGETWG